LRQPNCSALGVQVPIVNRVAVLPAAEEDSMVVSLGAVEAERDRLLLIRHDITEHSFDLCWVQPG
jgi:hypothetical protein